MNCRNRTGLLFLACLVSTIDVACASDAAESGVGGSILRESGGGTVRLVSQRVQVSLPECRVKARFVLKNDGPSTSVVISLPEEGYRYPLPENTAFEKWHCTIDGRKMRLNRFVPKDQPHPGYQLWWKQRVRFNRGQTRVVVNRFVGGGGGSGFSYHRSWFSYRLSSAATWNENGNALDTRVECTIRGLRRRNFTMLSFSPAPFQHRGDTVAWKHTTPKLTEEHSDIHVRWFTGFLNVEVNGQPVSVNDSGWDNNWGFYYAQRRGREVLLSLRTAAAWLGGEVKVIKPDHRVRLIRGARWAEATVGSRLLRTSGRTCVMSSPARIVDNYTVVALTPLVRALGGRATYAAQRQKMLVRI